MSIFDNIGGFLFGNGNQSKQTTKSSSTVAPYAPAIPYVNQSLKDTSALYGGGAPQISPLEQSGYDAVSKVAGAPSAAYADAGTQLDQTISGKYLTPDTNPYLADIAKRIGASALQTTNTTFGGAGRSNSGLAGYSAGQGVGDALTTLYGNEYNQERGLQAQATSEAPAYEQSRYIAPQALISAGQNVSARPFDINAQYNTTLGNIARLGSQTTGTSTTTATPGSQGALGAIANSFTNKLFSTALPIGLGA